MNNWKRCGGLPGPGDTAILVDGPGFDFDGIIFVQGRDLVIRRRNDPDEDEGKGIQRVALADVRWLIENSERARRPLLKPRLEWLMGRIRTWWSWERRLRTAVAQINPITRARAKEARIRVAEQEVSGGVDRDPDDD